MIDRLNKTERLIKIWLLLRNNPFHFTTKMLAERFDVNVKTIYRDLDALGVDLSVPVEKQGTKWGIDDTYFLPPIRFSVPEALNIFLASRLMLNYSHRYDPNIDSLFNKLSSVISQPLREQIQKTLDWMQGLPTEKNHLRSLAKITEAWVSRRQVKITYQALPAEKATERLIDPYFIEPAAAGHSSYVIAYCHRSEAIRTFKIDRIEQIQITSGVYSILASFDANSYLGSSWGIIADEPVKKIKLRFVPELSRLISETIWHPSQILESQYDGGLLMTVEVGDSSELLSWILGWGDRVEVLEPEGIRTKITATARSIFNIYQKRG